MEWWRRWWGGTAGVAALLSLVLAGAAEATWPVVDVEAIRKLGEIETNTGETASHTDRTRQNTEVMRAVLVEKQKLILALNQISLLQQNGKVLVEVAPTDQIVASVRQMVANPASLPEPVRLGEMPTLAAPSSAIQKIRELVEAPQRLADGVIGLGEDLVGWFSGAAGQISASPWGVLDFAEDGIGLVDQAGNLINDVSAIFETIDELVYTGKAFIGTNWSDVDEVVGLFDATIGEDGILPAVQIPVVGRLASTLYDAREGYRRAISIKDRFEFEADEALLRFERLSHRNQGPTGRLIAGTDAARRAAQAQLGDGVYIRPEDDLDAAYYHMVQKGSRAQRLAFRAALTADGGLGYDPVVGSLHPGEMIQSTNLNNSLSGGAYGAVERYRRASGTADGNAYRRFAATLAPLAGELVALGRAGKPMVVAAEMVDRAAAMPPLNLRSFGRLSDLANPVAERAFADVLDQIDARFGAPLLPVAAAENAGGVVTLTLPSREAVEYEQRIAASNGRIGQNSRMLNICVAVINYSQRALEAASRLRAALVGIAGSSNESNALESVPAMIQHCDSTILFLQRQISDYSLEVERLEKDRHGELSTRASFVRDTYARLEHLAMARIHDALLSRFRGGAPENLPSANEAPSPPETTGSRAGGIRGSDTGDALRDQTGLE